MMIHAVSGLVAERPEQDARVVLVALHVALDAGHMSRPPLLFVAQGVAPSEVDPMAFDICLVHDIKAVLIAELVEQRIVRIMRATDRIKVVSLHQFDVLEHRFATDDMAGVRVMLMPVHATDRQFLPIEEQAGLPDLHGSETNCDRDRLGRLLILGSSSGEEGNKKYVQVRLLGAPQADPFALDLGSRHGDIVCSRCHSR
mmetsp:Transcript_59326/g.171921  ORF Transcript_59326/g.171921 Transcript_59326/m.171921 type:complete len:200 (-) Transcript_59326:739-1338(-)